MPAGAIVPASIAIDATDALVFADAATNTIVRRNGVSSQTLLGSGAAYAPGALDVVAGHTNGADADGLARFHVPLRKVAGIAVDEAREHVYIFDSADSIIYRMTATGDPGTSTLGAYAGARGDGGFATAARLNAPRVVVVAPDGALLIADTENHRVRRVVSGIIDTVAGNGAPGIGEGLPATAVSVESPQGLAFDTYGNLCIACNRTIHALVAKAAPDVLGDELVNVYVAGPDLRFPANVLTCIGSIATGPLDTERGRARAGTGCIVRAST